MERWYLALMVVALLDMLGTLLPLWYLVPGVRARGIGRIVFFALVSLKTWVALVLIYFSVVIVTPGALGHGARIWIVLGLVTYLIVQSTVTNVAFWRWWREGGAGRQSRSAGIPDGTMADGR